MNENLEKNKYSLMFININMKVLNQIAKMNHQVCIQIFVNI